MGPEGHRHAAVCAPPFEGGTRRHAGTAFRRAGRRVTAYPVDYLTAGPGHWCPGFSLTQGLSLSTVAEKEWIGLAAYRLLGWTDRLFAGGDA